MSERRNAALIAPHALRLLLTTASPWRIGKTRSGPEKHARWGWTFYHAQAKREVDGNFFGVDTVLNELKSLEPYFQIHQNPHIDWQRMFADRGLIYGNYRVMSRATDGIHNCFVFVDAKSCRVQSSDQGRIQR
jgi:hypothetical protein